MNSKQKLIVGIGCFGIGFFFLWIWISQQKSNAFAAEEKRGELLVQVLAAANSVPLQNQLEPLVNLNGLDKVAGVVEAVVTDPQGKILVPLARFGEQVSHTDDIQFEQPILGLNKELLGKAIILFKPFIPNFYSLWFLFFTPVILGAGFYYFWRYRNRNKKTQAVSSPSSDDFYPWLSVAGQLLQATLYVFDEEGNILNASGLNHPKHLLDLFPEANLAQEILNVFHDLKATNDKNIVWTHFDKIKIGSWSLENETKRYLLACDGLPPSMGN